MPKRKVATEQRPLSTVVDDDYDPESQTVRVSSRCDEDEVPELDFHDDHSASGSDYWNPQLTVTLSLFDSE